MKNEPEKQPSAKEAFSVISGLFLLTVNIIGVFWAMIVKKPGTVGTRIYLIDVGLCWIGLVAMSQNPDDWLFTPSIVLLPMLWLWHLICTWSSPIHIHTMQVGASRFWGKGDQPLMLEFAVGVVLGVIIHLTLDPNFGLFIGLSAVCVALRQGMIEERDRLRAVQMQDAIYEQEYMMENYERYKK